MITRESYAKAKQPKPVLPTRTYSVYDGYNNYVFKAKTPRQAAVIARKELGSDVVIHAILEVTQ